MATWIAGSTGQTGSSVTNYTLTLSQTVGAGHGGWFTAHYATSGGSAIAISGFKDQGGNTLSFGEAGSGTYNTTTEFGEHLCFLPNLAGTVTGIEVIMASACNLGLGGTFDEYSGVQTGTTLLASGSSNATATLAANNITSGSAVTPSSYPALAYAISSDDSRSNHAPTVGTTLAWNARTQFNHPNTSDLCGLTEDFIVSSSTVIATFTNTGTSGDICPCIIGVVASVSSGGAANFNPALSGGFNDLQGM